MADLLDSFDELSGRERPRHGGYRFPDDTTHPLSSFSQRGVSMEGLPSVREARRAVFRSNADLEQTKLLYGAAQARTQQLAQIRDAQAGLYEAEERNRTLEHTNAAFDLLKTADPNTPEFEQVALNISKNHSRAFLDPSFKQAWEHVNGIYDRGVKADQMAKRADAAQQNALDRALFAEELRGVRGLGSDYRQMANARLAELPPDAPFADRQRVLDEIRVKADEAGRYTKLAEAGVPWEARRAGDRSQDQLIDPNTGMLDRAKADSWLRDAASSKEKVAAAKTFVEIARKKDPTTDAQWFTDNAEKLREAEGIIVGGFSANARKPKEDAAWAAVAAPTRALEQLNKQYDLEPDQKKKTLINAQRQVLVAQRDEAAKAHPGFNLSTEPEEGETEAQMLNRLEDNARTLLSWPTGAPITINGKPVKGGWTEADQKEQAELLARIEKGGAKPGAKETPQTADEQTNEAPAAAQEPAPTAAVPQVSPQQKREDQMFLAAQDRLRVPVDQETATRLDAELAQVPKSGFWAALEKHGGDPGTGSAAQEAVWSMFADNAKQVHVQDRLKRLGELYNAELDALNPKPSVFEQIKAGATRAPKAPNPRLTLPPEKEAAYENAALEILADSDPETLVGAKEKREKGVQDRDLGLALRKARRDQLAAELTKLNE